MGNEEAMHGHSPTCQHSATASTCQQRATACSLPSVHPVTCTVRGTISRQEHPHSSAHARLEKPVPASLLSGICVCSSDCRLELVATNDCSNA
jgi:hypothetical protein